MLYPIFGLFIILLLYLIFGLFVNLLLYIIFGGDSNKKKEQEKIQISSNDLEKRFAEIG